MPKPTLPSPPPARYEVYTCPELGRTSTRPNAYDAFELPSIYCGVRKPYRFGMMAQAPKQQEISV